MRKLTVLIFGSALILLINSPLLAQKHKHEHEEHRRAENREQDRDRDKWMWQVIR